MLQDAELCFTQINDLKQMLSGVLNIGISYTFAPVLMEAVKDFTRQYPGVDDRKVKRRGRNQRD